MQSLHTQMPPRTLPVPLQSACSFAPQQPCIFSHGSTIIFLSLKPHTSNLPPCPNTQHTLISSHHVFSFPGFESLQLAWPSSSLASGLLMSQMPSPVLLQGPPNSAICMYSWPLSHTHTMQTIYSLKNVKSDHVEFC